MPMPEFQSEIMPQRAILPLESHKRGYDEQKPSQIPKTRPFTPGATPGSLIPK
jgi:hypothetical protein